VRGRLDRPAQAQFAAQADEALTVSPYVIVNLARAEFLDSTAIGTLIGLVKRARDAGGELWLVAVPQQIDKVLSLLRLDRFFETRPDVVAALVERREGKAAAPLTAPGPQAAAGVRAHAPSGEADGWTVITMSRRVDATAAPAMLEQGEAALAASPRLILDFSSTVFLASAGMAVMVKLNRLAREAGGEVRAVACSADVARTLKLARLDAVIALYDDVAAATKAAVEVRPELVKAAPARRPS
jgi:N-acetylglucosaminyldiphosphoundecaprenol N-acetyl-beta-D-mannosaminyltransferase